MRSIYTKSIRFMACLPIVAALCDAFFQSIDEHMMVYSTTSFISALIMCQLYALVELYFLFHDKYRCSTH